MEMDRKFSFITCSPSAFRAKKWESIYMLLAKYSSFERVFSLMNPNLIYRLSIRLYLISNVYAREKKKAKVSLQQTVEAHKVVRRRDSHIL
jgi:hypothetical protein